MSTEKNKIINKTDPIDPRTIHLPQRQANPANGLHQHPLHGGNEPNGRGNQKNSDVAAAPIPYGSA